MSKVNKKMTATEFEKILNNEFVFTATETPVKNTTKKVITESIKTEDVVPEYVEALNYASRGFNTLEDAVNFVNTEVFARLGKADQDEYKIWLNKED